MGVSVGLLGLIGSGKDTFGEMLLARLTEVDSRFQADSYARPLKQLGSEVLGIDFSTIDDRDIKEKSFDFKYTEQVEDLLYNFMDGELGFVGIELSEGLRKIRKSLKDLKTLSPREFYQKFGTEVVRYTRSEAWIDKLHNAHKYHPVLVRDVRFVNEMCDINILVCRHEGIDRPEHESEHLAWDLEFGGLEADKGVLRVDNRGSLVDLEGKVDEVLVYLKSGGCL